MRTTRRILAASAVTLTLGALPAVPAAAAAPSVATTMVATINDVSSNEYELECGYQPGPCNLKYERRLLFSLSVSNFSGSPITFGFQLEGITATLGTDFVSWPYNPPNQITTSSIGTAYIAVNIIMDSVTEPTETMRVRLTSASRPVDISDTGIGTIRDGNQLPPDCTASVVTAYTGSMTCTNRPAAQRWRSRFECADFPPPWAAGNTVTGNGTSTATCLYDGLLGSVMFEIVP